MLYGKTKISLLFFLTTFIVSTNLLAQNSWKRLADFPTLRYEAVAFSIGNKGFVGTGATPNVLKNDLWEYNPDNDSWIQMASMPASGREGAIGFSINQKGYIGSGKTDSGFVNDFWEYDSGLSSVQNSNNALINNFRLYQNYPNPFNPSTIIQYEIPKASFVIIKVYDVLGRKVATLVNKYKTVGRYKISFNAGNLASGVYIYQMKAENFVANKKLILIK